MIFIWGWKVRFRRIAEGVFFCPSCGGDRNYTVKQGRRWFTIFFIPAIPLGHVGDELVECNTCQGAYRTNVLQMPTTADLSMHLLGALREALVSMFRQFPPTPSGVRVALEVLSASANRPWSEAELQADTANLDVSGLQARLGTLAAALNEHGKERLLGDCARVAAADGAIGGAQRQLLDHIASSLGMTAAHAHGVIAQVAEHRPL